MIPQYVNIARVTKSSILIYKDFYDQRPRSDRQIENEKNLKNIKYNGFMSPKTRSQVRKYLSTWLNAASLLKSSPRINNLKKKPYITFLTTTLPADQAHSDYEIKRKVLTPFIETLKRKYGVVNYFWRAESQKNGNIHFHLIIDSYIHWKQAREEWNQALNPLGYIDRFEMKYNHRNPNSTDIHRLTQVHNVGEYVIKYCTKSEGFRPIKGRIHGCSDKLKTIKPYEDILEGELEEFVKKVERLDSSRVRYADEYTVIYAPVEKWLLQISPSIYNKYRDYNLEVLRKLYLYEDEPVKEKELIEVPQLVPKQRVTQIEIFTDIVNYY